MANREVHQDTTGMPRGTLGGVESFAGHLESTEQSTMDTESSTQRDLSSTPTTLAEDVKLVETSPLIQRSESSVIQHMQGTAELSTGTTNVPNDYQLPVVSTQNTKSTPVAIQHEEFSTKGLVTFHVLVRDKDVTEVRLTLKTTDGSISNHDMELNKFETDPADVKWKHAVTSLEMCLDKEHKYKYSVEKLVYNWGKWLTPTIDESTDRCLEKYNVILDIFQFPDVSKEVETNRITKRLFTSILLPSITHTNFKDYIIQMERPGFPGWNDEQLIKETCEWINLKGSEDLTDIQLAFLAVMLAKVIGSSKNGKHYARFITAKVSHRLIPALKHLSAHEIPISVISEELKYLCILIVNSINGNWLHIWQYFFNILNHQTIDSIGRDNYVDMPPLTWYTWNGDQKLTTNVLQIVVKNEEAVETLFCRLIAYAKSTKVIKGLLELYQQSPTYKNENRTVQTEAASKLESLIDAKHLTRKLIRLEELWQMFYQTAPEVVEIVRVLIIKYLTEEDYTNLESLLLRQLLLNNELFKTPDELMGVVEHLLKQHDTVFQDTFLMMLECRLLMTLLAPQQVKKLIIDAIHCIKPWTNRPSDQPDAIQRLYRLVGLVCHYQHLDIADLRITVKDLAFRSSSKVSLYYLLKAMSRIEQQPPKTEELACLSEELSPNPEELACLSEHIQILIRRDKTVTFKHLIQLWGYIYPKKNLIVRSSHTRDVLLAMIDSQEQFEPISECELSIPKLEATVTKILQNAPFWTAILKSRGKYSEKLQQHSCLKAVIQILRQEVDMIRCRKVTFYFSKMLLERETKDLLSVIAESSPIYEEDFKQWKRDKKHLIELAKTHKERLDILSKLFEGCLYLLEQDVQIEDMKSLAKQLKRRSIDIEENASVTLYDITKQEYWGDLYDFISAADDLHGLAFSTIFLNVCRLLFKNACTNVTGAEDPPVESSSNLLDILNKIFCKDPITAMQLLTVLRQHCVPVFTQHCKNFLSEDLSIPVSTVIIMTNQISDSKELDDEIQILEFFLSAKIPEKMKLALERHVKFSLMRKRSEQLANTFHNFDIPGENDDIHNAIAKINGMSMGNITLIELDEGLINTLSDIEKRFTDEEWEITEQLAQSKELISFLRPIIAEDLRNLIDAVEERSERSIGESIVSDLIDVQRYIKPLLQERSGRKLLDVIHNNRTLACSIKEIPYKLDTCISNVHRLNDLYDNVANRGEMTIWIVNNALKRGVYSFKMDESSNMCRVMLSYKRGDSEAWYGLDDLNDLQSRALLLVNSRKDQFKERKTLGLPTPNLKEFVRCITTVNEIAELCSWLVNSGHFQFTNFNENVNDIRQLEKIRKELEEKYDHWQKILDDARQKYYFLYFFHSKQLLQLEHFFTEKSNNIKLLLKYINSSVDADEKLRQVYELPNKANDLQARLFALGSALDKIIGQHHPIARAIPGAIPVQKSTTHTKVYPGKVFVAVLDEYTSTKSISTMLRLYNNTTGLLPEPSQVIMCHAETSWIEIYLFLRRCVGASAHLSRNNLYTLVNVELLPLETQFQLVKEVTMIQRLHDQQYLLAMICRGENHHIGHEIPPQFTHRIQALTDAEMEKCLRGGWANVEIVTSSRAGLGKSEYVKSKANNQSRGVSTLTICGPVTKEGLVQQIQQQQIKKFEILHVDVSPISDPYLLECFLFELIVTDMVVSGTSMCMLSTSYIAIEIANTQEDTLRNSLTTLCMFKGKHLTWDNFQDYAVSMDINSPVQVTCHYLQKLKDHTVDSSNIILSGPNKNSQPLSEADCRELLKYYIRNQEVLTYATVDIFLGIFAQELRKMSASDYFTIESLKHMPGTNIVRSQLVNALMDISKELSSPSIQKCDKEESGLEQVVSSKHNRQFYTVSASKMVARLHCMVKWEKSNHLLIVFHQQDSQTVTPLYRLKSQVPAYMRKLFEYQMNRELTDYAAMTQTELQNTLETIVRSTRKKFDQAKLQELQTNYALTPDNLLKMVLIHMRVKSRIPVVIMGETGCGKTTLITYLARVCEINFNTLNIHAGVTQRTILDFVKSLQCTAEKNLNQEVWGFMDEINTCDHLGLLNEIICRRTCRGKRLPHNLVFLAACNPYRLRDDCTLTVGLQSTVERDDLSNLVYRVHPLPESMMDYVWDFGSLDRNDEEAYIRRMLEENDKILVDMIIMSQSFMRETEKTSYSVSLRDVNRCKHLCKWFEEMFEEKGIARDTQSRIGRDGHKQLDDYSTRSLILTLTHCYHARLTQENDRKKYRTEIASVLIKHGFQDVLEDDVEYIIRTEQLDLLNRMQCLPGTAKNEALRENVFVILVSIMNRLPVFVVGKPGCSKSLSMQLIRSNLRGGDSRDEYFKTLPAVYVVSYQGSESSTSEGIIKVFDKAKNYKKANPAIMPVVLLDEIGLAEKSSFNPLKVLHNQLEPTVGGFPLVAVVGISNWTLDAAKMNRAIHLSRPDPTVKDLAHTAVSIRDDCVQKQLDAANINQAIHLSRPDPMMNDLAHTAVSIRDDCVETQLDLDRIDDEKLLKFASAFSEYQENQTVKNFHGLRDYYSFVKYVVTQSLKHKPSELCKIIQTGILRNFGGLKREMNHILRTFSESVDINYNPAVNPCVQELIKSNLDDPNARHLMLITSGDSALNILEQTLRNRDYVTIFGSKFEQDVSEEYNYGILSDIILCMERGNTLILRDLENIYGSLYDMLNQNYTVVGEKQSCRVAHGAYSNPMCQVHKAFRCIVLVDEKDVDYQKPPFLNRFEKHTLRFSDILDDTQKEVIDYIDKWMNDISSLEGHHFSPAEMFIGLHEDTLPSLVCHQSENNDFDEGTELKTRCIADLMKVACPDAVLRISKSAFGNENPTEAQELKRSYFSQPLFRGLKYFLQTSLVEPEQKVNLDKFCCRLVVYTHSSIHIDLNKCLEGTFNAQVEKLSNIKSENQLNDQLSHFWMKPEKDLLIVQCISKVDSEHMLLTKCKIDEYRQEYLESAGRKGMRKHVIMIVHIKREDRVERVYYWQFNFLCGWQQFTLDTLEVREHVLSDLLGETISRYLVMETIKLDVLIEDLLLWCFSCIKYDNHFREVDDVVLLASNIAQSKEFKAYLKKRVLEYIQSIELVSKQDSDDWQVTVACDRNLLYRCSSLVGAMLEYINNYVKQPLARCVVALEMYNAWAGSPVSYNDEESANFWQACFNHSGLLDINSDGLPKKFEVESCIVECKYLKLKFPFFNAFHKKIEEQRMWLMNKYAIHEATFDEPQDKMRTLTEQLKDVINNTEVICTEEYICSHVKQFCDDLYDTFSFEYAPQLPAETRLAVMKSLMMQLSKPILIDQISRDPIYHIANVYANLWINTELLQSKVKLIAIYSDVAGKEIQEFLPSVKSTEICPLTEGFSQQEASGTMEETSPRKLEVTSNKSMSEDTNENRLVTEICKCMLPFQDTLQRIGGIEIWMQRASLLLILAAKVCDESEILQFLRLCLEFMSRLSNKFTECTEYLIALTNIANAIENPLESEKVFDFIVKVIDNLESKESTAQKVLALEEFLGIYFGLCLEVNVDSKLRPRIMQRLCKISGDLIVGSRHILLALLSSDIKQNQKEGKDQIFEQLIKTGQCNIDTFPNLAFIDCILQQNTTDCHLAVLCSDIVEEVSFHCISSAKLGLIASEDHPILITITEAVRYIQTENKGSLRLVVATAYIRAFTKAAATLLHGKPTKSFKDEHVVFLNVLNGLLQIKDESVSESAGSLLEIRLLKCLRVHKTMYQLQKWCDNDSLTSLRELKWQTVLLSSRLGYNPLAYVAGYTDAVNAIKLMRNNNHNHEIDDLITSARKSSKSRIALLAAFAEMFYFNQTTGGPKVTDKHNIQWLYDQTEGYTDVFREFCKRLLGLDNFRGILQIGEETSQQKLEIVSVVIHLMIIVVAYTNETDQPALLTMITNATASCNMYIPGMGQPSSFYSKTLGTRVKSSFCPCGLVLVDNNQRTTVRCPVCKRKQKQEKLHPLEKITPPTDVKGFTPYDMEDNSRDTDTQVRDLSTAAFRIIRLLLHCCLLGGHSTGFLSDDELLTATTPTSNATVDNDTNQNDSNVEQYFNVIIRDWRLLENISSFDHESVTLLIHSVIDKSKEYLQSTSTLSTTTQRNDWEKLISEIIDEQLQALPYAQSQFKRICFNAQGIPNSCLETQIEEIDSTNQSRFRRLFRNTRSQSFSDFKVQFVANKARHPFLRVFFRHHYRLQFLKYLPALLNWNKHILKTMNHKIRRIDATQFKVVHFLDNVRFHPDEAARTAANAIFEQFQEAWNNMRQEYALKIGVGRQIDRVTGESWLSDCIIDACEKQNVLREMIRTLQSIQNEFLMETMTVACSEYCPALNFLMCGQEIAMQRHSHLNHANGAIISYTWSDDILVFSDINTEYGRGTDIRYNYGIIEDKIARKLVQNKAILTDGEAFTQFSFADDLTHSCSKILAKIKQSIHQEPLSEDLITIIKTEQERRQTFAKDFLEHLEVILVLLKKAKGDPSISLDKYINRWSTHLPSSFSVNLIPEPKESFKLHHIVHLYEVIEDVLVDNVDDTMNDNFRKPIPDTLKCALNNKLLAYTIEKLETITLLIKRFIFRYLRYVVDNMVYKRGLSQLMEQYAGTTLDCNVIFELLPDELAVEHVVKTLEMLKDHIKKQRRAERMRCIPSNAHLQKGAQKRHGNVMKI